MLAGSFYPLPAAAVLQNSADRLTLLTRQPHGAASLRPGQLELILDRRISSQDHKGNGEPTDDNTRTRAEFALVLETLNRAQENASQTAYLSAPAQTVSRQLLHQPALLRADMKGEYVKG